MKFIASLLLLCPLAFAAPNIAQPKLTAAPFMAGSPTHDVQLNCTGLTGVTSYNFKRATTTGGPYITVGNSTTCSFDDTSTAVQTEGSQFFYVATAVKVVGSVTAESSNSNEVTVTISLTPPPPPTGLTATPK